IDRAEATRLLGTMQGGYNVEPLIQLLDDDALAQIAADALKHTLLVFDALHDVEEKGKAGNKYAKEILQSWADAEWFTEREEVPEKLTITVFKVTGETNTDDLSPAQDAWSRPDIPLHANAMLKNSRDGITADKEGELGPVSLLKELEAKGHTVAYVGDVVRSEEHTSELQSRFDLVCRLLLEKKKTEENTTGASAQNAVQTVKPEALKEPT